MYVKLHTASANSLCHVKNLSAVDMQSVLKRHRQ